MEVGIGRNNIIWKCSVTPSTFHFHLNASLGLEICLQGSLSQQDMLN